MSSRRTQAKSTNQISNDRVIVTEWRFSPGAETGWHTHNYDYIIVPGYDGKLLIETSKGNSTVELKAGESYYRNLGIGHNVVNINDYEFYFIEIELI